MTIQEAVKACRQSRKFARPLSWEGNGWAVDLGRRLQKEHICRVSAISDKVAIGAQWLLTPEELLDDWILVDLAGLAQEEAAETDFPEGPIEEVEL